jgi:hypothetical protein
MERCSMPDAPNTAKKNKYSLLFSPKRLNINQAKLQVCPPTSPCPETGNTKPSPIYNPRPPKQAAEISWNENDRRQRSRNEIDLSGGKDLIFCGEQLIDLVRSIR